MECPLRAGLGEPEWWVWRWGEPSKVNAGLGRPVLSELLRHPQSLNCPRQVRAGPRVSPLLLGLITHISARGVPSPEGQRFEPRPQAAWTDGQMDGHTPWLLFLLLRPAQPGAHTLHRAGSLVWGSGPRGQAAFPRDPRQRLGQGRAVWAWRSRSRAATGQTLRGLGARAPAPNLHCLKWPHADRPAAAPHRGCPLPRPPLCPPPPVGLLASVLPPPHAQG